MVFVVCHKADGKSSYKGLKRARVVIINTFFENVALHP